MREKTILIDNQPVKLYSLDGKLWFSKPHHMKEFKQREAKAKASVKVLFTHWDERRLPM